MSLDRAVRAYQKIRERRADIKREYDAEDKRLKQKLTEIENFLMTHLTDQRATSIRCADGLVFIEETMKASIADWGELGPWIVEHDALDMLQRRLVIGEVKKYLEEHEELPPGVSTYRERTVRVRKS